MDVAEFGEGGGVFAGHVAEGDVAENDVGRHAAFASQFTAQGAKLIEEGFVAGQFAGTGFAW